MRRPWGTKLAFHSSLVLWCSYVLATPLSLLDSAVVHQPRPLVLWHGMGDTYDSPAMLKFINMVKGIHKGIFVHSVFLDADPREDEKACFWGDVNSQIANVSEQLANIPELSVGFDAMGFSQGGQFLRAYVERYNNPPVNNLITFGSQHMGVSDLPLCRRWDIFCQMARRAARNGVYSEWAQTNLVQAQYFRDPSQLSSYLSKNRFLASINNEVDDAVNTTYATNLAALNKLVLIVFLNDKTVVPKESGWFGSYTPPSDGHRTDDTIIPMRLQPIYKEDRIGLRALDERGGVILEVCEGEHMQLAYECWEPIVKEYVGSLIEVPQFSIAQPILQLQLR